MEKSIMAQGSEMLIRCTCFEPFFLFQGVEAALGGRPTPIEW